MFLYNYVLIFVQLLAQLISCESTDLLHPDSLPAALGQTKPKIQSPGVVSTRTAGRQAYGSRSVASQAVQQEAGLEAASLCPP